MNTHGNLFRITTFGESHGNALGVVIDGLPANFKIDFANIAFELGRRKPGQSKITTQRKESDEDFEVLSGIFEGYSTGHPIAIIVKNQNQKSKDYDNIKDLFRPNHADLTYFLKYGIRDYRGGGRSSGRETLSRVIAGAIAKQYLKEKFGIEIFAFTSQVGTHKVQNVNYEFIEQNILRTADEKIAPNMIQYVEEIAGKGNSVGGIIECHIKNPPSGLGEPVFGKIKSILASSMLSIGGVLGFEYGAGFDTVNLTGESYNEGFEKSSVEMFLKNISTENKIFSPLMKGEGLGVRSPHNNYNGVLGGITTGEDVIFRIAVKPTSSIYSKQKTVDINGNSVDFQIEGRHDPCILPRVVPVVESMAAIDMLDLILMDNSRRF